MILKVSSKRSKRRGVIFIFVVREVPSPVILQIFLLVRSFGGDFLSLYLDNVY